MVIPSRRFRSKDMVIADPNKKKKSLNNGNNATKVSAELSQSPPKHKPNSLDFKNKLKDKHNYNRRCVIYLLNGIKLQGRFCGSDDEIIILESLDRENRQLVYQDTIAVLQFENENEN
jgi:sRNA-binding regulator protein Hfq